MSTVIENLKKELTEKRIYNNIQNTLAAISEKGISIEGKTSDDLAELIDNIEVGGKYFPNGTEWTPSNIIPSSNIPSSSIAEVHFNNGIWIARNLNADTIYYSNNGKYWSEVASIPVEKITYGKGLWIASTDLEGLYYSTNGKDWTKIDMTNILDDSRYTNISAYYYNGTWVAVAYDGDHHHTLIYSNDGIIWNKSNLLLLEFNVNCNIIYGNGVWILNVEDQDGRGNLYYSVDGKIWTQTSITCNSIVYGSNAFFAVTTDDMLMMSKNGYDWEMVLSLSASTTNTLQCCGDKIFIMDGSNTMLLREDLSVAIIIPDTILSITYANDIWVAFTGGGNLLYSYDAIRWDTCTGYELSTGVYNIAYNNGIWIAACSYEVNFSIDGINWFKSSHSNNNSAVYAIKYANGVWVMATDEGLYYSVSWEP